ncbi:MAG: phosphonate C-P lyase system protein PhnG [Beijerinckiaceae bacterium]|nr:phosphonate C-P lyase system protein PhnG [Beijerinckiaceae bacterium]
MEQDDKQSGGGERAAWMSVLARASYDDLLAVAAAIDLPDAEIVKPAESGTLMIEARAGGSGRRFNAGEATVTRCIVRTGDRLGYSYALGRDKKKAVLAARLDLALQDDARRKEILAAVVEPLCAAQTERRQHASRSAAATKVEFFTLVRGDG